MPGLPKRLRYGVLFPALARLPLPLAYGLATAIGILDLCWDGWARRAVADGLRLVFPHLSLVARAGIMFRHFVMKARECLDAFVMAADGQRAASLVRMEGVGQLRRTKDSGRGVILVMAHFGRINLHALGLAQAGERLGMLTMSINERNLELDEVERVYLERKATTLHSYIGGRWVTIGGSLRGLYRGLARGETIIILLDAYVPRWEKRAVTVPFLGGHLALPSGIRRLAARTGARLVYGWAAQQGWRVDCGLVALAEDPEVAFLEAVRRLEEDVRRWPWLWWHWNVAALIWRPSS